eukprot:3939143-Rhodomonas_salina.15
MAQGHESVMLLLLFVLTLLYGEVPGEPDARTWAVERGRGRVGGGRVRAGQQPTRRVQVRRPLSLSHKFSEILFFSLSLVLSLSPPPPPTRPTTPRSVPAFDLDRDERARRAPLCQSCR